jgi:hypothetical protein
MVDDVTDGPPGQPLAPLDAIPPDLLTLADYEARAEAHMPAASWRHVQEGSGREITLRDNRAAFDRWRLLPRALADLRGGNTALDLFGRRHARRSCSRRSPMNAWRTLKASARWYAPRPRLRQVSF